MGLFVNNLKMDPSTLKQGNNKVAIKFSGVVDDKNENPVNIIFTINPAAPAYFVIPGKGKLKTVSFTQALETELTEFTWKGEIEVPDEPAARTTCGLQLDATDVRKKNPTRANAFFYISQ